MFPLAAALALAACQTPTETRPTTVALTARNATSADAPAAATAPPTVDDHGGASLEVRGLLDTPTACQNTTASVERVGDAVTLTVEARSLSLPCALGAPRYAYVARILTPAGQLRVRVFHRQDGAAVGTGPVRDTTAVVHDIG